MERTMLDAYVIEEIRRRERRKERDDRPVAELPVPRPPSRPTRRNEEPSQDRDRGVVIIDYSS
jgi:hypothetical protein